MHTTLPPDDPTFLRSLLDAADEALFVIRSDGRITYANRGAAPLWGEAGLVGTPAGEHEACSEPMELPRDRLTEPYVTTRAKGTGLGLAILKKIMEDHGGTVILADREGGGAVVTLQFPAESGAR